MTEPNMPCETCGILFFTPHVSISKCVGCREWRPQSEVTENQIRDRDRGSCLYCNEDCGTFGMHLDHVIPVAYGGLGNASNIALACSNCNSKKRAGLMNAKPWLNLVAGRNLLWGIHPESRVEGVEFKRKHPLIGAPKQLPDGWQFK